MSGVFKALVVRTRLALCMFAAFFTFHAACLPGLLQGNGGRKNTAVLVERAAKEPATIPQAQGRLAILDQSGRKNDMAPVLDTAHGLSPATSFIHLSYVHIPAPRRDFSLFASLPAQQGFSAQAPPAVSA